MAYNPNLGVPGIPAETDSEWGFEQSEFDFNRAEPPETVIRLIAEPRVSQAQYDLGGNPHEMTDEQVLGLAEHGLGGARGRKLQARRTDVEADREHFGMTGSEKLSTDQLVVLSSGARYTIAEHRRHRSQAQIELQATPIIVEPWE